MPPVLCGCPAGGRLVGVSQRQLADNRRWLAGDRQQLVVSLAVYNVHGWGGGGSGTQNNCVQKVAESDFPSCKFRFSPRWSRCPGRGGGVQGRYSPSSCGVQPFKYFPWGGGFGMTPGCIAVCAYWPLAGHPCPFFEPSPSAGGGADRPPTPSCPPSPSLAYPHLSTPPSFPSGGYDNGGSVSGPHGGVQEPSPLVRCVQADAPAVGKPPQRRLLGRLSSSNVYNVRGGGGCAYGKNRKRKPPPPPRLTIPLFNCISFHGPAWAAHTRTSGTGSGHTAD